MATHAPPRMAADQPKGEDGEGPLKNGTGPLEDSDDSSSQGALAKNRSPHAAMDGFQDGGGAQGGYPQPHNYQPGYNNNSSEHSDSSFQRPPSQDYAASEYRYDQHGEGGKVPQYPQQQQPYMRPPYSPRGAQPRYPRFGAQQQTGPTPTLNQLLQAPNQRYNSYEYPQQKEYPNNSWPRYPQQHPYRNQPQQHPEGSKRPYPPPISSSSSPFPPRHPASSSSYPQQQPSYGQGGPAYATPPTPQQQQQPDEEEPRATPPQRPPSAAPPGSPAPGAQPPSRPPSTQPPEGTPQQGYNQQMAPPPSGGMYGSSKMQHPPSSAYPSSHYPPQGGGYHRASGYGGQAYSGYPPRPSYPYNSGYPSGGQGGSYGMMPPPNQYPKAAMPPPPQAGAQAAAQAAVIAAAAASSSSGVPPPRQPPLYLRQHLQQKMYNSYPDTTPTQPDSYNSSSLGAPPSSSPSDSLQSPRNSMGPPPCMDEGSQASNASASSSLAGEERVETPKPSKQQASPGAASLSSFHDDFESVSSPSWPRTPASPVINSQPFDHHPIKRPDGMLKLYDMSEDPERRAFLDKLIAYQEERGTPLSQCPTISKQPLDLFRLYLAAKERGGFVEVMKGKMWKEIAGLVGIGASSSAAYTLRKQYIKHLLPFECKFDRGGIDPAPLISSLESNSRKKAKNAATPGGPLMDGYPGPYPGGGYPPNSGPPHPGMEYPGHHSSYPDAMHPPNHHGGVSEGAMDPFSDEAQYPAQRPPAQEYPYPPQQTAYPQAAWAQPEAPYSEQQPYPPQDPYAPPPGGYPPNRTVGPAPAQYPTPYQGSCGDPDRFSEGVRPSTPTYPPRDYASKYPPYAQQQDPRPPAAEFQPSPQPGYPQQQGGYGAPPPNKVAPPGSIPPSYKRDYYPPSTTPYAPATERSPQYPYRPPQAPPPQQQGWQRDSRPYGGGQQVGPYREGWPDPPAPPWARYDSPYPHKMRAFPPNKMQQGGPPPPQPYGGRREVVFPPDTVEGVAPLVGKRRRLLAKDVSPVDPWRLMMALKSGLLGESTWALDVLAVLIHDDSTVLYFGLAHLQGLLEVLMEHYRRCLNLMFNDLAGDMEVGCAGPLPTPAPHRPWYDLEADHSPPPPAKARLLHEPSASLPLLDTPNYTWRTRCRKSVRTQEDAALFLFDPERKWDAHEGCISGSSHWQHGGGEYTGHVQTHFEDPVRRVRFVRLLREEHRKSTAGPSNKGDTVKQQTEEKSAPENSIRTCGTKAQDTSDKDSIAEDDKTVTTNGGDSFPKIRPASPTRKRRLPEDLEDESYTRDEPSLCTVSDAQDSLARRCIAASSILRNLSFVPGNDSEMSKHAGFLLVMGRLLLLHHTHSPRRPPQRHYDREDEGASAGEAAGDSCSSLSGEGEWWWETLHAIRENTLVTLANISGQLDLAPFPEEISFPILDGLLHWVTCPSSRAQDPLPTQPPHSVLSPQRLSLEALAKLSVLESNVDLMMAVGPWPRTDRLLSLLARWLGRGEDQVLREFSVVLLSNLSQADSMVARAIALQAPCIPLLLTFVEQAEASALQVANAQGINALRENPELMGTTLDMVRRAAGTLRCLARVPANRPLFLPHQQRLLALVMSQILDQGVAAIVADVLFECSREDSPTQDDNT